MSRRRFAGATLGALAAAAAAEVASLTGRWDHRGAAKPHEPPRSPPDAPDGPRLTHVGHSCHLIEIGGRRWLTDPWFFDPAFGSLTHRVAFPVESLARLDGIFISHRHPDHFDPEALRRLPRDVPTYAADPLLLEPLRQLGYSRASLSHPWQSLDQAGPRVSFVPALHDVPQHSLVIEGGGVSLLFCGDTGPHDHWSAIRERHRPTAALLPCDGTRVRWEGRHIMNPAEAAAAARALGCHQIFQTHADAEVTDLLARYVLSSSEPRPVERLSRLLAADSELAARGAAPFEPLQIGETRALSLRD